jgi:uncharacterized protein (DUF2235 family)
MPSKNIVFCGDGTCNGPQEVDDQGLPDPTNVYKLFVQLCDAAAPAGSVQENELETIQTEAGTAVQLAKYIDGVGNSDNPLVKLLGGAEGAGLVTRIVRGYTYISRSYTPGDNIYLIGFSRGAYTARALAGLILYSGLLDPATYNPDDREQAYRLGAAAWYAYQRTISVKGGVLGEFDKLVNDFPAIFSDAPSSYVPVPTLRAIGVWDTVGAYGFSAAYDASGAKIDLFPLANTTLNLRVGKGYQAISIDEQRDAFVPILWDQGDNVVQCLFAGAHADIGGGYSIAKGEAQLSDIALAWMIACLRRDGLRAYPNGRFAELPNPAGLAHQQWRYAPWPTLPRSVRSFAGRSDLAVDPSVAAREAAGTVTFDPGSNAFPPLPPITGEYRPLNLP